MRRISGSTLALTALLSSCGLLAPSTSSESGSVIGASGGTVNGANASAVFPAGAVPNGTVVSMKANASATTGPDGYRVLSGSAVDLSASGVTVFSQPVGMTLTYTDEALAKAAFSKSNAGTLALCKLSGTRELVVNSAADTAGRTVTGSVTTPGTYGICKSTVQPTFTLTLGSNATSVQAGAQTEVAVTLTRVGGFDGAVSVELVGAPQGVTGSVTIPAGGTGATMNVAATASVTPGVYDVKVRATSGAVTREADLSVTVTAVPAEGTLVSGTIRDWDTTGTASKAVLTEVVENGYAAGVMTIDGTLDNSGRFGVTLPNDRAVLESVLTPVRSIVNPPAGMAEACTINTTVSAEDAMLAPFAELVLFDGQKLIGAAYEVQDAAFEDGEVTAFTWLYSDRAFEVTGTTTCNDNAFTTSITFDVQFEAGWNKLKVTNVFEEQRSSVRVQDTTDSGDWLMIQPYPVRFSGSDSVRSGESVSYALGTGLSPNSKGAVTASLLSAPAGITAPTVQLDDYDGKLFVSGTLTVSVAPDVQPGSYPIKVRVEDDYARSDITINLNVTSAVSQAVTAPGRTVGATSLVSPAAPFTEVASRTPRFGSFWDLPRR